jgi:hypothetical protein
MSQRGSEVCGSLYCFYTVLSSDEMERPLTKSVLSVVREDTRTSVLPPDSGRMMDKTQWD